MGSILCEQCAGACCRYLALPLDVPENRRDFDDIRWYMMHEGISVFVEDGDWYVQIQTRCKNLAEDHRCGVYETRPSICREYEAKECDYSGAQYGYDHLFTHPKQIEEYYEQEYGKKLAQRPRTAPALALKQTKKKSKGHVLVQLQT